MKKIILLFCIVFYSVVINAQEFENVGPARSKMHEKDISKLSAIEAIEDTLVFLADSMYFSQLDESRVTGSEEFIRVFKRFLKMPNSYSSDLPKLKEKITILTPTDNSFRLYNWEVIRNPVERRYYGVVQTKGGDIYPFNDVSDQVIRGAEDSLFSNMRWYGSLYYNMISKEVNGEKMYFLFGWNGNSMNSEKKIVEALSFPAKGKCAFGAPVFNTLDRGKRKQTNRFVMEYEKGAKVSMNFDAETSQIIFDHCESQIGDPAKKYTYVPDGTYDGLRWKGIEWEMNENVIQITILKDGEAPVEKK